MLPIEKGTLSESQAEAQSQRLNIMHERSAVATAVTAQATQDLSAEYIGFGTQVLPMLVVAGASVMSMFKDMNIGIGTVKNTIGGFKDIIGDIPKLMKAGITGGASALGGLSGLGSGGSRSKSNGRSFKTSTTALEALNTGMATNVVSSRSVAIAQIQAAAQQELLIL